MRARSRALLAVDAPGALDTRVATSMGVLTIDQYLVPLERDALVHAWDLSVATGLEVTVDPDLVDRVLELIDPEQMAAGRGGYGPPRAIDRAASSLEKLLAATGRTASWSPDGPPPDAGVL